MMNGGVTSSPSISSSSFQSPLQTLTICSKSQFPSLFIANHPHNLPTRPYLSLSSRSQSPRPLSCSASPGSRGPGESDSRTVLDAFFLGKALGEALTERIESAVGEFLSTIGRLQAEQQKQVQEFQEDVLERAKRAKDKAAREALEQQGRLIPNSTTASQGGETYGASPGDSGSRNPAAPAPVVNPKAPRASSTDQDSLSSIPIDE